MRVPKRSDFANIYNKLTVNFNELKAKAVNQMTKIKKTIRPPKTAAKDKSARLSQYANLAGRSSGKRPSRKFKIDTKRRKKAEYLSSLPKHPLKRLAYRLHPKHLTQYWFSKRGALMALKIAGISFAVLSVLIISVFAFFRKDLPNPRDLTFDESTRFYDRTGETLLFSVYGDENRTIVDFDQISDYAKWATISLEDKNFYNHGGFSVSGILRATLNNILNRDATGQGGSTITQQFIKNSLVGDERSYTRKLKELILAVELERLYTKDEVLAFYLNEIPYGSLEYGIESASNGFFDKSAKDLTIDEAALIAALPQAPSLYSPYGENTDLLVDRQHFTINQMKDQGYISEEEANAALEVDTLKKIVPIDERNQYRNVKAPHFVDEVLELLKNNYSSALITKGGLRIITTLDLELQDVAEKAMKDNFQYVQNPQNGVGSGGDNAAISVTDVESGQILAQVGSRDYFFKGYGAFNAATAGRQPGSSFKPFAYSQLFYNERWSPGSIIWDTPTTFSNYRPNDFDFKYPGPMTIRDAIGRSRNIPAVKALYIAGVDPTIELARSMGNKSLCNNCDIGLSLVLGAGEVKLAEHTHAFSTFARGGIYKPQTYVLKIETSDGEILEEWKDEPGEQVLDAQIAYLMTSIISDDVARSGTFGLGNPRLVVPELTHTVKTGTTDESKDGWMMGYTTCLAVGVWAGNHDAKPMDTITSWQTGPMWTQVMREAHKVKKCGTDPFVRPEGIKNVRIDRNTGRNATDKSKNIINDIAASWFVGVESVSADKVVIDSISKKLATDCTPERAKQEISNTGIAPELEPTDPFYASWAKTAGYSSTGIKDKDDVHKCDDKLPQISLEIDKIEDGLYEFKAIISEGDFDVKTLNFKVDGTIVSTRSIGGSGTYSYNHVFNSDGNKKITAEVIDEVLYDNSMSQDINVSAYSSSIQFDRPPTPGDGSTIPPGSTNIKWNNVVGANKYQICFTVNNHNQPCETQNDNNYPFTSSPASDYTFTINALLGSSIVASGETSFFTN
jgi:penicillin-binding protein 1A